MPRKNILRYRRGGEKVHQRGVKERGSKLSDEKKQFYLISSRERATSLKKKNLFAAEEAD